MNNKQNQVVVLGNGPSLKGFNFLCLSNVDSIGMNAAYRHWERINWYPTHYVCLDDQLIETHACSISHAPNQTPLAQVQWESCESSGRGLEEL